MADEDDLVSKVSVEGTEAATAKLNKYANDGAAAFDKLDKSAKDAAAGVRRSSNTIETSAEEAARGLRQLAAVRISNAIAPNLKNIEAGARNMVVAIRSGIPAIASFVTRLTAAGTAAAAAGVGILKLASNVAKASTTAESAIDRQTNAQVEANNAQLQGELAAINLESSQRKLFQQLQAGQITYTQYSASLRQLNADYQEQQRVARQTEQAQERVRLENERLQKQAADTKAFQAQIDIFGGPLLSSLIRLGNQASQLFNELKQTFGPVLAQGIDLISNALSKNGASISRFFGDASRQIALFIDKNGPAIELAFTNIGNAIKFVFDGVMAALPGLLDFFNNSLVPAMQTFSAILSGIATAINAVFGTQLTGGALVFLTILGQMTGSFVALINVVRILGAALLLISGLPFGAVLLTIAAAIGVLLFLFPSLRQVALDVLNSIIQAFQGMLAGAVAAGEGVKNAFSTAFTGAADLITAAWNAVVAFFTTSTQAIAQVFTDLWNGIVASFNSALASITSIFTAMWNAAKAQLQPILDLLRAIASLAASVGGTAPAGAVTAAGGGHIRGPGTSTSDSIPAWLSDGEFVIRARSVAKYGAGLLNAINRGTFKMPRFNLGGLVSGMINPTPRFAYAEGGEVRNPSSMRPINLQLFGEEFNGLLAPEDVGERLTKFAVSRQTRSAGRKPAWLGRGRN